MPITYEAIATVTVGSGGAADIQFTSIPGTYTDLLLKLSGRTTASGVGNFIDAAFNGSTSNFSYRLLEGNGSSALSTNGTSSLISSATGSTATSNTFGNSEIYIANYNSSNYKSISSENMGETNATTAYIDIVASLWSNTAAITSITLTPSGGNNFVQYSTATLYGIKNS